MSAPKVQVAMLFPNHRNKGTRGYVNYTLIVFGNKEQDPRRRILFLWRLVGTQTAAIQPMTVSSQNGRKGFD